MLKSIRSRVVLGAVLLAMPLASASSVQAVGPTGSYSSGIACVNLGAASASIAVTFYSADNGTAITTYSVPGAVAPKNNVVLFTPSIPGLPSSLQGSAVVSSDQQVACTADAQRSDAGGVGTTVTPARAATSESFDVNDASATLYATQVVKTLGNSNTGFFNSYIAVQNIESAPVTATVSYVDRFGVAYPAATESVLIPPQASHYFYQESNAGLPSAYLGSATIASSDGIKKLAATVSVFNDGLSYTRSQITAFNAAGSGGLKLTIPQFVRNYFGFNSGTNIMNIGAATTTVTSTFTFNGVPYVRADVVGPKKVLSFFATTISQLAPVDALANGLRTGQATFEAGPGGLLAANSNRRNDGPCTVGVVCPVTPDNQIGLSSAFRSFASGTATTKAIVSRLPRNLGGEKITAGFVIANSTATPGTCDIEYVGTPAANETGVALAANGIIGRFATNVVNLVDATQNPVSIVCTQPVFVSANSRSELATYRGDSNTSWNAINIP